MQITVEDNIRPTHVAIYLTYEDSLIHVVPAVSGKRVLCLGLIVCTLNSHVSMMFQSSATPTVSTGRFNFIGGSALSPFQIPTDDYGFFMTADNEGLDVYGFDEASNLTAIQLIYTYLPVAAPVAGRYRLLEG